MQRKHRRRRLRSCQEISEPESPQGQRGEKLVKPSACRLRVQVVHKHRPARISIGGRRADLPGWSG